MTPQILSIKNNFIAIAHPDLSMSPKTYLAKTDAAATALTVLNNDGIAANDYLILGHIGEDKTELTSKVDSTTGSTVITVNSGISFDHPKDTLVSMTPYDKIEIYMASTETGEYSLQTTVSIQPDQEFTAWEDTDLTSANWYKVRFKNTAATLYSAYSDAVQSTGFKTGSVRKMIDAVRRYTGVGESIPDDDIIAMFNDCQDDLIYERRFTFVEASTTASLTASTEYVSMPTGWTTVKRVRVTSGSQYYYPRYMTIGEYSDLQRNTTTATIPQYFTVWNDLIYFYPTPSTTGTNNVTLWGYSGLTDLTDENAVTEVPIPNTLVYYACEHIELMKGDANKANAFNKKFGNCLRRLKHISKQEHSTTQPSPRYRRFDPNADPTLVRFDA